MLCHRIFTLSNWYFRTAWWICIGLVTGYCIALIILVTTQCSPHPIDTLWNNRQLCNVDPKRIVVMGFLNVVVDIGVLLLPIPMVWRLQMSSRRKLLVSSLFAFGLL